MSDEKPIEAKNADDLTKTKKPAEVQLTEEELAKPSGGGGVVIKDFSLTKSTDAPSHTLYQNP